MGMKEDQIELQGSNYPLLSRSGLECGHIPVTHETKKSGVMLLSPINDLFVKFS